MFKGAHESYILWYIFYMFLLSGTTIKKQKISADRPLKRKQSGIIIFNQKRKERSGVRIAAWFSFRNFPKPFLTDGERTQDFRE